MALDLERLRDVGSDEWNREWQQAWNELALWDVAVKAVGRCLQKWLPQHVESVAQEALVTLARRGISRCRTIEDIVPLLKRIAVQAVVTFFRRSRVKRKGRDSEDEKQDENAKGPPPEDGEDSLENLKNDIAERLHLEGFDLETLLRFLVREAELSESEEALLREHIVGPDRPECRVTQQEFADKYGLSVHGIGGRRERVLKKLRVVLEGHGFFVTVPRRNWAPDADK